MQKKIEKDNASNSHERSSLTKSQESAVEKYTSKDYQTINGELRSGNVSAKTAKTTEMIDSAISSNKTTKEIIVYRGTTGSFSGKDKAYSSTSTNPLTAGSFARGSGKVKAYRIPKGTNALSIGGGEGEVLFGRGFDLEKFRIK